MLYCQNHTNISNIFIDTPDVTVMVTNTTTNALTTELRCHAVGVPATYTYTWNHTWPGHATVLSSFNGSEVLRLERLTYQDSGYYTCKAENGVTASRNPGAGVGTSYLLVEGTLSKNNRFYQKQLC